jgi:hypothetical protein
MVHSEFDAGADQVLVVYLTDDTGNELDPEAIFGDIAVDSATRAAGGYRIVSAAVMPRRHSAVGLGREGSGFQTKAAVAVVYARP